ncbi:GIY-YIG nuclease family protein [Oceanospirillum beijerinckii]|uniref:GIY-YIG nuclease family protein n=1 Tax=Oceanospirillum beijerinckii TaxID=64976 RepID=UPI0004073BD4|nr:GIY-YIG nuclease family protein [Oceanospirillum beijerinckii]
MEIVVLITGLVLSIINVVLIVRTTNKREDIINRAEARVAGLIGEAQKKAEEIVSASRKEAVKVDLDAQKKVGQCEDRVRRLESTDKEIAARLRESRLLIDEITDRSSAIAADVDLINEEDLLSSQTYQEDRKQVKAELKKLAINAIDGIRIGGSDVNIGKFVAISTKADMAGALLLTTVEMLCSKTTANNGHQSLEKLTESIVATEALIKCLDSRAFIKPLFIELLVKRLEIEINFKKARQLAKEQQRELREQEREEKKARQEAERIQKEAEKEEKIKQEAIAEMERKMAEQSEADRAGFEEELLRLKAELEEAHQRFERAKSRAQETRQGHVYVISNIGSFGEDVLKIGMTRRMEPMDRVRELGDAGVPFTFDVHALIESDDAPELESSLHKVFDDRRVNKVNRRKEYFNVTIDEIEQKLEELGINALINKVASADEYYQSIKLSQRLNKDEPVEVLV